MGTESSKIGDLYMEVEKRLDKLNYGEIWSGFSRMDFAIYNEDKVFLKDEEIDYDTRFLGNTSIDYQGRNLAIYNLGLDKDYDLDEITSIIVHESFHSHQIASGEKRFPNDLLGLDYPKELNNYKIKHRENQLLVQALNSKDQVEKFDSLKEFIGLRMARLEAYPDGLKYEMAIETIEGSAEYCGIKALRTISQGAYEKKLEDYKRILLDDIATLFDIRRVSYYVGVLFLLLLDDLSIYFTEEIGGQEDYIFEEVAREFQPMKIAMVGMDKGEVEKKFIDYIDEVEKKFTEFYKSDVKVHKGNFEICGYDPMNMIKRGNEILCSNFIMLRNLEDGEKIFVKGPLLIAMEPGSLYRANEYYC